MHRGAEVDDAERPVEWGGRQTQTTASQHILSSGPEGGGEREKDSANTQQTTKPQNENFRKGP